MKKIKLVIIVALMLLTALFCNACSMGAPVLKVESRDYKGLRYMRAGEPDEWAVWKWNLASNPYHEYGCYVSEENGKLLVSVSSGHESPDAFSMRGHYGYFVGVDMGEFDGWLKCYPYFSAQEAEIVDEPVMVSDKNCRGIVKVNNTLGYAFGWTEIYKLVVPEGEKEWTWAKTELDGMCLAYSYCEESETIYIATSKELLALSVVDDSVTVLADLSLWGYAGEWSMLRLNDKVYVGMSRGIYEYDLTTGKSLWYPLDFEKYVK